MIREPFTWNTRTTHQEFTTEKRQLILSVKHSLSTPCYLRSTLKWQTAHSFVFVLYVNIIVLSEILYSTDEIQLNIPDDKLYVVLLVSSLFKKQNVYKRLQQILEKIRNVKNMDTFKLVNYTGMHKLK